MNELPLVLGKSNSGIPILWKKAENPHAAILGRSGSGKSYFLRGLLQQAARDGAICVVLDYSNDFVQHTPPEDISYRYLDVSEPAFSVNPLADAAPQTHEVCAQRLMGALGSAFRLGTRAMLSLRDATLKYLKEEQGLPTIKKLIRYATDNQLWGTYLEPLKLLDSLVHCGSHPVALELNEPGITVLGFAQVADRQMRALIIELVLQGIWCQRTVRQDWEHPLIVLLDEAQNISWRDGDMATLILREGRKYGLGGWFSTQWLDRDKHGMIAALGQADLQANFRPDNAGIFPLAKRLGNGNKEQTAQYQKALYALQRGQFLLKQPSGRAIIVNVPSLNQNSITPPPPLDGEVRNEKVTILGQIL